MIAASDAPGSICTVAQVAAANLKCCSNCEGRVPWQPRCLIVFHGTFALGGRRLCISDYLQRAILYV
jgi:hypothetical protein